jgi:hypothetical protein
VRRGRRGSGKAKVDAGTLRTYNMALACGGRFATMPWVRCTFPNKSRAQPQLLSNLNKTLIYLFLYLMVELSRL